MQFSMHATKLVVADVKAAERFYTAIGMQVVGRNLGGEEEVRQEQCWLSANGSADEHILILSKFVELPAPRNPAYPGEIWLCFRVPDVDETILTVTGAGGAIVRAGEDRPEHGVRAAVVSDCEGHHIELVGPMLSK